MEALALCYKLGVAAADRCVRSLVVLQSKWLLKLFLSVIMSKLATVYLVLQLQTGVATSDNRKMIDVA
jgi:hypothetical protein